MELSDIHALFEKYNEEFIRFENIPLSDRPFSSPDICAFAYLDKKFPSDRAADMVSAASHDLICLRLEWAEMETLTEEDIIYLTRCGVMYYEDSLAMFV